MFSGKYHHALAAIIACLVIGAGAGAANGTTTTPAGTAAAVKPTLAVIVVGSGRVTSAPAGISCPGKCSATFAAGARVVLTATAKTGSRFLRWGGNCKGAGACRVRVSALSAVSAQFAGRTPAKPRAKPAKAGTAALVTFVDRIEGVLAQSAAGRRELAAAIGAGLSCSISPRSAGQRVGRVAASRQGTLGQVRRLQAPTQQARGIVTLLQRALQYSIEADLHYRDGFYAVPANSRCPLPTNAGFRLAAQSDARATAAKRRFVAAFNPLAKRLHRKSWSVGKI
jgi:Divergent InlB B-repeat domain